MLNARPKPIIPRAAMNIPSNIVNRPKLQEVMLTILCCSLQGKANEHSECPKRRVARHPNLSQAIAQNAKATRRPTF
jgi:hypothetical protein